MISSKLWKSCLTLCLTVLMFFGSVREVYANPVTDLFPVPFQDKTPPQYIRGVFTCVTIDSSKGTSIAVVSAAGQVGNGYRYKDVYASYELSFLNMSGFNDYYSRVDFPAVAPAKTSNRSWRERIVTESLSFAKSLYSVAFKNLAIQVFRDVTPSTTYPSDLFIFTWVTPVPILQEMIATFHTPYISLRPDTKFRGSSQEQFKKLVFPSGDRVQCQDINSRRWKDFERNKSLSAIDTRIQEEIVKRARAAQTIFIPKKTSSPVPSYSNKPKTPSFPPIPSPSDLVNVIVVAAEIIRQIVFGVGAQ